MGIKRGPTPIVTEGLVLYLDAANYRSYPGSGTDWIDLSGYGNHATLSNGPTFDSNNQGSFVFDGTDDYFSGTFSCNKTYYSVDWWTYPTQLLDYNQNIVFNQLAWGAFVVHTTLAGGVYVGTTTASRITPWANNVYVANTWQNFTWTFDNGAAKFYKNGSLQASATLALSTAASFTSYSTGGGSTSVLEGKLPILRVYSNKVLTEAEIQQNFNATKDRYGL